MKELIDYFNEKYTKKRECICKDLKPIKLLNINEYNDFREKAGIRPLEVEYFPLFELPKTIEVDALNYIFKLNEAEFKGVIYADDKGISYENNNINITTNKNKCVLCLYSSQIYTKNANCSLTLYTYSPKLPKIEYPKNRMDMYRAYNFIKTINYTFKDNILENYLKKIKLPFPKNIDEMDLYSEDMSFIDKDMEIEIDAQYMDVEEFIGENWDSSVPKPSDKGWCINLPFGVMTNSNIATFKKDGKKQTFTMGNGHSFNKEYIGVFDENNKLYFLINKETSCILKMIFFDENIDLNGMKFEYIKGIYLILKGLYHINPNKDNYYTILDAIKNGEQLFNNYEVYPNWKINKEEKSIWVKKLGTFPRN